MTWYYTDPLAAAWMAKHFGMRFEQQELRRTIKTELGVCDDYSDFFFVTCGDYAPVDLGGQHFHIHPDSLHLLEQLCTGDLVRAQYYFDSKLVKTLFFELGTDNRHQMDLHKISWNLETLAIVQRNGIAFMWPEHED